MRYFNLLMGVNIPTLDGYQALIDFKTFNDQILGDQQFNRTLQLS